MKNISGILLSILAFIIGASVVNYGLKEYRQYQQENNFNTAVKEATTKLDGAVANDTSDRTYTEKLYDASQDMISARLEGSNPVSASNDDKSFAAGVFAGQYGRHVIFTHNYCKTLGVDVSDFSNRYKNAHKDLYKRADAILNNDGSSVEKTYNATEHIVLSYIKKEVSDIRIMFINETGNAEFTLADSCNYYNQVAHDPESMAAINFSIVAPKPFEILMNN